MSDQEDIPTGPEHSVPPPPLDLIEAMVRRVLGEHAADEAEHHTAVRSLLETLVNQNTALEARVSKLEGKVAALEHGNCPLLKP